MRKIVIFLIFILYSPFVCSQETANSQNGGMTTEDKEYFDRQVKQVEEFIARFNLERDKKDKVIIIGTDTSTNNVIIKSTWSTLINDSDTKVNDSLKVFLKDVYLSNPRPKLYMDSVFSIVTCKMSYQKTTEVLVNFVLKKVKYKELYRWAIVGAKADFIEKAMYPRDGRKLGFVSPSSHNTNFIDFSNALRKETDNITNYTSLSYETDELSIILFLLKTKQLEMKLINNVSFTFLEIPNWILHIEHFKDSNTSNSGWLISNVFKHKDNEKSKYKKNTLGIR